MALPNLRNSSSAIELCLDIQQNTKHPPSATGSARRFTVTRIAWQSAIGCLVLAALTYGAFSLHLNLTSASFLDLMLVFCMALLCGFWQASILSVLAFLSLDYFFTEPRFHFPITDFQDWISLGAFLTASIVISRLSAKELRAAREAAARQAEMEQLYELSRNLLLLDMHQPVGPQLVTLIHRISRPDAVALFDATLAREDHAGDWAEPDIEIAKKCYLDEISRDEPSLRMSRRVLRSGPGPSGALVVRGKISTLVVDALASLSSIAIERFQSFNNEERAEDARRSEQLRAAVMDSLAHQFKTPLASVHTACSGLLEFGGLGPAPSELLAVIAQETARMHALCTKLLLTAKLESGKMPLASAEIRVDSFLSELLSEAATRIDSERIRVVVEDPDLTVRADRSLLSMILTQYIDNARKYSFPGTQIDITARRSYSEALFSVHNQGPTIALDDRERIFDRFYRSPDHLDSVPGTGIGLSVVRKAATAHRGHVWVVSDRNEGTTFFLSIPIDGGQNGFRAIGQ